MILFLVSKGTNPSLNKKKENEKAKQKSPVSFGYRAFLYFLNY